MANNFRISGNYYLSKAAVANDNNNGTDKETPKATLAGLMSLINAGGTTYNAVIGTGTYEESGSYITAGSNNCNFYADGDVVLRGNGSSTLLLTRNATYTMLFSNFRVENYSTFSNIHSFNNCTFKDINNFTAPSTNTSQLYSFCVFINCNFSTSIALLFDRCIFMNCSPFAQKFTNCYINGASNLTLASNISGTNCDYNNIMGMIRMGAAGSYQNLADHQTSNATINVHSISKSPLFNNAAKYDFTLQYNSPHINTASDGASNIGGTKFAVPTYAINAEWQTSNGAIISKSIVPNATDETSDLILSGTDYILAPGKLSGYIISTPIKAFSNSTVIEKLQYNGYPLFNKNVSGGSSSNFNVPDANVFTTASTSGGNNPDRLSIEMRWSNNDAMPGSDSDWDNSGANSTGTFLRMELNQQPFFDNNGYGSSFFNQNAYTSGSSPVKNNVNLVWVQFKVWLTNSYTN